MPGSNNFPYAHFPIFWRVMGVEAEPLCFLQFIGSRLIFLRLRDEAFVFSFPYLNQFSRILTLAQSVVIFFRFQHLLLFFVKL